MNLDKLAVNLLTMHKFTNFSHENVFAERQNAEFYQSRQKFIDFSFAERYNRVVGRKCYEILDPTILKIEYLDKKSNRDKLPASHGYR